MRGTSRKVIMTKNRGMDYVGQFFPGTGATYDHIVNLCTFGCDGWWKKKILEKVPAGASMILDQACGTGILTLRIARRFPAARIVGVDMTPEYLEIAEKKAGEWGFADLEFIFGRAEDVLLDRKFDCITSSYLAKYAELGILIRNARTMLRPDGVLIMHDFTYPASPLVASLWESYFKILQSLGARRYPPWKAAFDGLPSLLRETTWVSELTAALQENHFTAITVTPLTFGTAALVTAVAD